MIIIIVFDVDDDVTGDIGDDVDKSGVLLPDFDVALHVDVEAGQLLLQLREVRLVQAGAVHLDHCHHHHHHHHHHHYHHYHHHHHQHKEAPCHFNLKRAENLR